MCPNCVRNARFPPYPLQTNATGRLKTRFACQTRFSDGLLFFPEAQPPLFPTN
ncbi:hypothetical protein HMPREF9123_2740 [Neisseria bacilliformis ATCC BAA-1200]|uniref:Uncharacterized protein n=1 Tax=Neisseria bacilliformis ATCC BAA-1200 TaxID=888742 RepID=F2BG83_9NEIS|nr:hypothetical protein HMPREF9123_2740 [Neisseria bacilliformis ATCC BAA-1200]